MHACSLPAHASPDRFTSDSDRYMHTALSSAPRLSVSNTAALVPPCCRCLRRHTAKHSSSPPAACAAPLDEQSVNLLRQLDSVHHRLTAERQLPPQLQDQHHLGSAVQQLTDVLATHSHSKTLEIVNRCPALLQLPLYKVRGDDRADQIEPAVDRHAQLSWQRVRAHHQLKQLCTTMRAEYCVQSCCVNRLTAQSSGIQPLLPLALCAC
jgi:hypothetical protein